MKVSVIIAAYNAEKYLVETMESIVNQTIDDYEIIVIDDGSEDETLSILNDYSSNYDNLTVLTQENSGPSAARNKGLDIAKGDYVFFFDADDILESNALEEMYKTAASRNADLVIAKYDVFDQFKSTSINNINSLVVKKRIKKYDINILWTFSLSNKLFRRSLIEKYHFRLADISYSEDGEFLMKFLFKTKKITGLDMVIFHYRRMTLGEFGSITSYINASKVKDYITAHNLILKSASESLLNDNKSYKTIEEAKKKNPEIREYINEIVRKELQVLLEQFYSKFWNVDEETVKLIVDEVNEKIKMLDVASISLLKSSHSEFCVDNLITTRQEALENAAFSAVLYGNEDNKEKFINCLFSLTLQTLTNIKIFVPYSMKEAIEEAEIMQENIILCDVSNENDLYYYALQNTNTEFIVFCDARFFYYSTALKRTFKYFRRINPDFVIELIYHGNFGELQPVTLNKVAFSYLKDGYRYGKGLATDRTLANKFFKVHFLRKRVDFSKSLIDNLKSLYGFGYYNFLNNALVVYDDINESFIDVVATDDNRTELNNYLSEGINDLKDAELKLKYSESLMKLQKLKNDSISNILKNIVIYFYSKNNKVKNQVLFYSIRKNKELEGNSQALYPYIKGNKIIKAKQLPHNVFYEMKMIKAIMTSKVIITDDYLRYLRHLEIKPGQRVIQLWHACGAFKKFGQRGTNIAISTDNATHAQYNMVSVSGDYVRSIYADAFDVNIKRVKALGCPSTDKFFDKNKINKVKDKIYSKHPEFKDKYVIIYAPTFRDIGNDRTVFEPEIDFDKLSKDLLPNQVFLICPHPVMKNKIVDKNYENIKVMRDFSTDELMLVSDMLVTDYSSVIFEYSLLNKPIVFYCYDLMSYNRDFYLNYPDDLPGEVLKTQDELTEFIKNPNRHIITDKYNEFVEKYMSGCDGKSAERIAKMINSYLGEN